jgi:ribosome-binding factor A
MTRRTERLNSLLREVVSDVIHREIYECDRFQFVSVTRVEITADLHQAKVFLSFISQDQKVRKDLLAELQGVAGAVGAIASKRVRLRFFPHLTFHVDDSVEKHQQIDRLIDRVVEERDRREVGGDE